MKQQHDDKYSRMRRRSDRLSDGLGRAGRCAMIAFAFCLVALVGIVTDQPNIYNSSAGLWDNAPLLTKIGFVGMIMCLVVMIVDGILSFGDKD